MTTTKVAAQDCPKCGHMFDACSGIDHDHGPKPEDLTLCINCGAYLRFDTELRLLVFPEAQLLDLKDETRLLLARARNAINVVHADG